MLTKLYLLAVLGTMTFNSGCVSLGWVFGPGFSCLDKELFVEPPVIVPRDNEYYLSWTQGSFPFFFMPKYKVMEGELVFAMVATTSSGNLAGRKRVMKIEGTKEIAALRSGGAVWWESEPEPGGRFVKLRILKFPAEPVERNLKRDAPGGY